MPRINRGALERGFFHVLNRGNHRQPLFQTNDDYAVFLGLSASAGGRFPVRVWGYCLMPNHWHMVIEIARMSDLSTRPRLAPWDRGEHWRETVNQPLTASSLDSLRQVLCVARLRSKLNG